jgi:hypothetical protein
MLQLCTGLQRDWNNGPDMEVKVGKWEYPLISTLSISTQLATFPSVPADDNLVPEIGFKPNSYSFQTGIANMQIYNLNKKSHVPKVGSSDSSKL